MTMLDTIKKAAKDAIEASNPVNLVFGEVRSINPLMVNVDQRFNLTADFLIVPESLTKYELNLTHAHQYEDSTGSGSTQKTTDNALTEPIVIRSGLQVGDKLILLRMQGGQKYLILDKVVNI